MNINQIINIVLRLVMREGRRRSRNAASTPAERERGQQMAKTARRTGQASRLMRMLRRFR